MKKKITASSITIALCLILIVFVTCNNKYAFINLVWASPGDVHDNDIQFIEIWQYNGTDYNLKHNLTSTGGTYRVVDGQVIKFIVNVRFNNTLATSEAEATDYTRLYMNITNGGTIWNNVELNNTDCNLVGDFYILNENGVWNATGYPQAGVTYACTVLYQGYY